MQQALQEAEEQVTALQSQVDAATGERDAQAQELAGLQGRLLQREAQLASLAAVEEEKAAAARAEADALAEELARVRAVCCRLSSCTRRAVSWPKRPTQC